MCHGLRPALSRVTDGAGVGKDAWSHGTKYDPVPPETRPDVLVDLADAGELGLGEHLVHQPAAWTRWRSRSPRSPPRFIRSWAGLNPARHESETLAGRTPMTHRGRAGLRAVVYMTLIA